MEASSLYPLKFKPTLKEKVWGGKKFSSFFKQNLDPTKKYGESWQISDIEGDVSIIENGFLEENSLVDIIELYMGDLVGDQIYDRFGLAFPLLFKFIDANEKLSLQVHPDSELAYQRYQQLGKTELWYIIDAKPNAGLYIGFNKKTSQEEFLDALAQGELEKMIQFYPVKKGDAFFIPAGTIHAIGEGILLAEIQEASDITYRVFDWNRKDESGMMRELHIEEALEAINYNREEGYKIEYKEELNSSVSIIQSEFFNISKLVLDTPIHKSYIQIDSFVVYMCTEGEVHFFTERDHEFIVAGESILIPAVITDVDIVPKGKSELLEIYISHKPE